MAISAKILMVMALFFTFLTFGCSSNSIPKNFPDILKRLDPKALASVSSSNGYKGDGFFFSNNGCLITVRHFKDFSAKDKFTIWNGYSYTAWVEFDYLSWDIVVLKANGSFPKVPIPDKDIAPKIGETVYAITRNNSEEFQYITGTIMLVDMNVHELLISNEDVLISGTYIFWSNVAAQPGWSGSYVISESGGVGYLFASNLKNLTYFHPISYEMLNTIFPNLTHVCH